MTSKVYFAPARGTPRKSQLDRIDALLAAVGTGTRFAAGDLVAVKTHWGERGNTAFVPPVFLRRAVAAVAAAGARPFVTDTCTLYRGSRHDAVESLRTAAEHGFGLESLGCPVVVADGLRGTDGVEVPVPHGRHLRTARVASAIAEARGLVVVSHVKGHMVFGFGAALKNLGMGCCIAPAKQQLHSDVRPRVHADACVGCGRCAAHCAFGAIRMEPGSEGPRARIDPAVCSGCAECLVVCPEEAIPIDWEGDVRTTQEKTAEVAWAAVQGKEGRAVYLSFLTAITPDCDCCSWSDAAILPDIGFLASLDPVAIDRAAVDLVNRGAGDGPPLDRLRAVHDLDWEHTLRHAEDLGLGSNRYERVDLG